jgi:hypothetical protein
MKLALVLLITLAVVLFVVYAQRRGWINLNAAGSGVNAGLAQAGQFVDPPTKHVVEAKQARPPADAPGAPPVM